MSKQFANNYLRTTVYTATPEQLQLMLYDGAIRFAEQGRAALLQANYEQSYRPLARYENRCRSDQLAPARSRSRPLWQDGRSGFVYRKLIEANVEHKIESVDEALGILRYQRETWQLLMEQVGKSKAAQVANQIDLPAPDARMERSINTAA